MNSIKNKIAAALAVGGIALAISPATLADTADIQIVPRDLSLTEIGGLNFGRVFRPESGDADANFGLTCTGTSTQVTGTGAGLAVADPARACGEIEVNMGDADRTFTLAFGGTGAAHDNADSAGASTAVVGGATLDTTYTLYNAAGTGLIPDFAPDGTSFSGASAAQSGQSGDTISYYIGGSVVLTDDSPIGAYTGTYEIAATVR